MAGLLNVDTIDSNTSAGPKIKGRTDGAAASSGYIGQTISSFVSLYNVSGTVGAANDVTSISLTAGVWLIQGNTRIYRNAATMVSYDVYCGYGTLSGTNGPNIGHTAYIALGNSSLNDMSVTAVSAVYSTASTQTIYLKYIVPNTSAGTAQVGGSITATRIA